MMIRRSIFVALRRSSERSAGAGSHFHSHFSSITCQSLIYEKTGNPESVLQVRTDTLTSPIGPSQVRLKMLAAPINPADINMVEGVYGTKPTLPAIGGGEGVGVVEEVGRSVTNLKVGEWVIPANAKFGGTWRTGVVCDAHSVDPIPNTMPLEMAATLRVNPCTAYRLLADFGLKPGDVVIQNGPGTGVGQAVIQLAKRLFGVCTINVLRDGANYEEKREQILELGGDVVVKETAVATPKFWEEVHSVCGPAKPKVAFNCVGGKSATDLCRTLGVGGLMVTYGGLSKKPMILGTGPLIFHDLSVRGFWYSRWVDEHAAAEKLSMVNDITKLIEKGDFRLTKAKKIPFLKTENGEGGWEEAIKKGCDPERSEKIILTF